MSFHGSSRFTLTMLSRALGFEPYLSQYQQVVSHTISSLGFDKGWSLLIS